MYTQKQVAECGYLRGKSKDKSMVVFSKFLPMYLLIIHCTGTVMLLGDGEVNKLPNDGGRKNN